MTCFRGHLSPLKLHIHPGTVHELCRGDIGEWTMTRWSKNVLLSEALEIVRAAIKDDPPPQQLPQYAAEQTLYQALASGSVQASGCVHASGNGDGGKVGPLDSSWWRDELPEGLPMGPTGPYEHYARRNIVYRMVRNETGDETLVHASDVRVPRAELEMWLRGESTSADSTSEAAQSANRRSSKGKRTKVRAPEDDAMLVNRINSVLAAAKRTWPKHAKLPGWQPMSEELAKSQTLGFAASTIRQIVTGRYLPMRRLGLKGLNG
jgi:hypothetical protein